MKLSNARCPAGSFKCDSCSAEELMGFVFVSFYTHSFSEASMTMYKCVFPLHYFYEHPLEG